MKRGQCRPRALIRMVGRREVAVWAALGLLVGLLAPLLAASPAAAAPGDISTYAGGNVGDGGSAVQALLAGPDAVAVDAAGNIYIDDASNNRVRRVDTQGVITTLAGTGTQGYSGDGGPAMAAKIGTQYGSGIAIDGAGNVYFAAVPGIRKIDTHGIITTFAGKLNATRLGDGGPATSAWLLSVQGLALDRFGNLFFADVAFQRVRKIDTHGIITTVAGNGTQDLAGDGGPATKAALNSPEGITFDPAGDLIIPVQQSARVRRVVPGADKVINGKSDEVITTIAGADPGWGFGGDGGPATAAQLSGPTGAAVDAGGNIYITDTGNGRIRKVDSRGIITTFAGSGGTGFRGDGGPALAAQFNVANSLAVDRAANLVIADAFPGAPRQGNNRIRRVNVATGIITTVAGGGEGDGRPATQAALSSPYGITVNGVNTYISEGGISVSTGNRVRKVGADGVVSSVAGGGAVPRGDGGPATAATIDRPDGVAVDSHGNVFFVDTGNARVRKVASNGTITTVAGGGAPADGVGDHGPATAAKFNYPSSVAVDAAGDLFIGDAGTAVVRKVAPSGIITTVAGTGTPGFSGDGGAATAAQLSSAYGVALDSGGNLFIADTYNHRIRRVGATTGIITSVAGTGNSDAATGDNGPATAAAIPYPLGVSIDSAGNLYTASEVVAVVRKITPGSDHLITGASDEIITTVAGGGMPTRGVGDGGPATQALLDNPQSAVGDGTGNLIIADTNGQRIRKVTNGTISTIGGTGTPGFSGDGGPATAALLSYPSKVAVDSSGNVFLADQNNNRIRRIDHNGVITTIAGGGVGDGLAATSIALNGPRGVAADDAGNMYIAECGSARVRKVDATTGVISTYAGGGTPSDGVGDGKSATSASLACPTGLYLVPPGASQPAGTLFIADCAPLSDQGGPVDNPAANRVRKVDAGGTITTIAGTARPGFTGDGGPATRAQLNCPSDIHPDAGGNLFIADRDNNRVRRIDITSGVITTVAGDGANGFATGGRATTAHVNNPTGVAFDAGGNLLIAENSHARVTKVSAGKITVLAGQGVAGFAGDGGPAASALLGFPTQVAVDSGGNVLITDGTILSGLGGTNNNRVRKVESGMPPPVRTGCGRTITHDTKLVADVGPCPADGIVVGQDNITLDLNGHKVLGAGPGDGSHPGIRLAQHKGVTITNGTVSGFAAGIAVMGGSHNTISKMTVTANHGPPPNLQAEFGDGIIFLFSSDNLIANTTIAGNGPYDGIAMEGLQTNNNTVQNNIVRDNGGRGIISSAFFDGSLPGRGGSNQANNVIANKVFRNGAAGISNLANQNALISGNDVEKNGLASPFDDDNGIGVQALQNSDPVTNDRVESNTVHGNGGNGIVIPNSHRNYISNNNAADNAKLSGNFGTFFDLADYTYDPSTFEQACTDNVWFNNTWGSGYFDPSCTTAGGTGPTPPPPPGAPKATAGKAPAFEATILPPQRHLTPDDQAIAKTILGVG